MRKTNFFIPVLKENPVEASVTSHQLMLRSGMIRQLTSGIYSWLPLGKKVLNNIENIIRKNMDQLGASEVILPCIQPADLWKESGRYDHYGQEMLRMQDRHNNQMLFGPSHEEVASDIFRKNIFSYKQLPLIIYQMHWKFRDEIRPRFGVMRSREFHMKDGYSFDITQQSAEQTYSKFMLAYNKIFSELNLEAIPIRADSGPIGGNLNHEFHILANTGESKIYCDKNYKNINFSNLAEVENLYAVTEEKFDPNNIPVTQIEEKRGIEVGHIFYFGTKYSKALNITIADEDGQQKLVHMGSYGIGISRLVAALIEVHHDKYGINWPLSIAPFKVSIINLKKGHSLCDEISEKLYKSLLEINIETLYDDEEESPGSKFATHDLIGTPIQIIIGPREVAEDMVEIKMRKSGQKQKVHIAQVLNLIKNECKPYV